MVFRKGLTMAGFFRILLGGAVGAVLGILFVRKQRGSTPFERPMLPPARTIETPVPSSAATVTPPAPPQAPPAAGTAPGAQPMYVSAPQYVQEAPPAPVAPAAAAPAPVYEPPVLPVEVAPVAPVQPTPFEVPLFHPISQPPVYVAPEPPPAPVAPTAPAPVYEPPAPPVEAEPLAPPVAEVAPAPVYVTPAPQFVDLEPVFAEPAFAEPIVAEPEVEPEIEPEPEIEVEPEEDAEPEEASLDGVIELESGADLEEILAATVSAMGAVESDVVFTPEVLEDPVPGAGWEPTAVFLREEAELEELLPMVPDSVQPYVGVQVGDKVPLVGEDDWIAAGWPEIAEATAAESVASMTDEAAELERPVFEEPPATVFIPEPVLERAAELVVEPEPEAEPTAEVVTEPEIEPSQAAAEAELGDDLKSRIEETRRRIREELEKPFAAVDESPFPEPVRSVAAPAPVIGEAIRASAPAYGGARAQPAAPAEVASSGMGADYDAMRSRIELTRSRLKAKAFDAMMAGEAALLGRAEDQQGGATRPAASFDSEIEQTVDNTLREEDR